MKKSSSNWKKQICFACKLLSVCQRRTITLKSIVTPAEKNHPLNLTKSERGQEVLKCKSMIDFYLAFRVFVCSCTILVRQNLFLFTARFAKDVDAIRFASIFETN